MSSSELDRNMSDVEKAFAARQKPALKAEKIKHGKGRARRKRIAKEVKRELEKERVMNPDLGNIPPFCTMKTETVYMFFKGIGEMAQGWKEECRNMITINPHNPAVAQIAQNIERCANNLATLLQNHVKQVDADNLEMQKKAEALNAQQMIKQTGTEEDI